MARPLRIDAHQHAWDLTRAEYPWLATQGSAINRSIDFGELLPSLKRSGIDATVMVQAADHAADTSYMLEAAAAHPEIVGVVAWAPLDDPDEFARRLAAFSGRRHVVGVRNLIHDRSDPDWLRSPPVMESLSLLEASGLSYDLSAVLPRHLEHLIWMGECFPGLPIVVDHLAKPPIGLTDPEPWRSLLVTAAENPNVCAKVSALYPVTGPLDAWTADELRPWFDLAIESYGAHRVMYGGDWPVCELAGGYDRIWDVLAGFVAELSEPERDLVLGGTAQDFYRIDPALLERARVAALPH